MNAACPTVFVVDDDPAARAGTAALVSSMGLRCEAFSAAEEFFDRVDLGRAGCVIADMEMTRMSGMQLQERLVGLRSALPVVLIGDDVDVRTAVHAMQKGAVSVLQKPYDAEQLEGAVRRAIQVSHTGQEAEQRRLALAARFDTLNAREREVLTMIVNGLPNKTIARQLGVCQRTAAQVRADVYEKMGAESAVELALMASALWSGEDRRTATPPHFLERTPVPLNRAMAAECGQACAAR